MREYSTGEFQEAFIGKLNTMREQSPQEAARIGGALAHWGTVIDTGERTIWDDLHTHLLYKAYALQKEGILPTEGNGVEHLLDYAFQPSEEGKGPTAETVLYRFGI